MPVFDWLAQRADVLPSHPAVATPDGRTVSYRELDARATALAEELLAAGVAPGDRVALLALNSLEFVVAVHAVPRAGGVLVPLNARLTAEEAAWQLRDCAAQLLLCHPPTAERAGELAQLAALPPPLLLDEAELASRAHGRHEEPSADQAGSPLPPGEGLGVRAPARGTGHGALTFEHAPDDTLAVIYTSGTTGTPKGAQLTFGNFFASAAASAFNMGVDPGDRWVACLPLFHVGGLSVVTRSVIYGTTIVLHQAFDEAAVNVELRERGATLLSVVPTMLQRMLDTDDLPYPAGVRGVLVGGGPCTKELLERALGRGLPVLQTYGLTEATSQVTTLAPADALAHVGSAGKALLGTRVRIDAPPGEAGEILVAGPTVTSGYLGRPEATAAAIRDGWLHTGDIGRLDEHGFLWVLDRRDDLIVSGGENVYPAEVEGVIKQHPAVADVAVVGLPDERWGQLVAAVVVARAPLSATELAQWCRPRMAGYKLPRRITFAESLPSTASGKVQRGRVRAALGG
ncbi:MAG: o-succinylbenzoate--CoA ligase [Dehalococcoidia bacterium]|nr:o-succinylbenzoate--CoA ligase [Dehalococcoidia bacterium]